MIELFARLNPKSINQVGSTSTPLIEITDLCGVLAKLGEQHSWYIYAMIEQRRSYNMDLLHKYCQQVILQEMLLRKFKSKLVKPSEFAYGITKAVIYSHFHSKGKCPKCNGLGRIGTKKCEKCEGSGNKEYSHEEKVSYGFPMRKDLSRQWYRQSCNHYDQFVECLLIELRNDLFFELDIIKKQALQYKRDEENADLFDDGD
ncbi:hypothetical protein [Acinetobacter sp. CFCC 10889]|uniref:hypothetical protein n=1 Tax=Acinetobacter sp. CFCC 10889 TaxID=1775557 RepID=UPI000DCF74B7|nr:hypothetical protein [Acinetobacter sp. CFCC 10889]